MKKVLLFLFFIVSVFVANSQTLRPSQLPTTNAAGRFDITGYQMDSAFLYVLRDSFPAKYPSVIYHPNGNLYKTTGGAGAHWSLVTDTTWLSNRIDLKLNIADTAAMLSNYLRKMDTANLVAPYMKYSDTSNMLTPYHQSFYTATFDTATRILTMYPITGTVPTILSIPRGGSISGIASLTPYRVPGSDVQYLVADNGDAPGFTLKTADSATIMHFSDTATMLSPYAHSQAVVKYYDTSAMLSKYVRYTDTANIVANRLKISDTATMLANRLKISDTATMLAGYKTYYPRTAISGGSGITYDPVTGIISNGSPSSGGTVTSVSAGVGMNFPTITTTGPVNADTLVLATRLHVDSIAMRKLNLTDTAAMLSNRLKISDTATMLRNHATYAETLTGKNISGSANNLSNIANSSLVNSTISGIPLGSNLGTLSNGYGVSGGSYNGSTGVSLNVDTSKIVPYTDTLKFNGIATKSDIGSKLSVSDSLFNAGYTRRDRSQWLTDSLANTIDRGAGGGTDYYFNGGDSSTVSGYKSMSKTANTSASVNFTTTGVGILAKFITAIGTPNATVIPSGTWRYSFYASVSTNGGTPQVYTRTYYYHAGTPVLIGNSDTVLLAAGTTQAPYFTDFAMPQTNIDTADRVIVEFYTYGITSRSITLYTQDNNLAFVGTTFSRGISSINNLTATSQVMTMDTTATGFSIQSSGVTHTFKFPPLLRISNQAANTFLGGPLTGVPAIPTFRALVAADLPDTYLPISDTSNMLSGYNLQRVTNLGNNTNNSLISVGIISTALGNNYSNGSIQMPNASGTRTLGITPIGDTLFFGANSIGDYLKLGPISAIFNESIIAPAIIKTGASPAQILAGDGSVITAGTNITISGGTISSTNTGGTVTSISTNNGTGINGGTITTTGTLALDTLNVSTRLWRQKGIDSVMGQVSLKVNISDTMSMLSHYTLIDGTRASGTWNINIMGTAGSETLSTVTGRGANTSTAVTFNGGLNSTTGAFTGTVTSTVANGVTYAMRSGASGSYTYLDIGRTANEATIGIAAISGNFLNTSVAGDVTINNTAGRVLLGTDGLTALTINSSQQATFASSVTASSLIKSGGTSSQALIADGSVLTLTNGTYTPTISNTSNVASSSASEFQYMRVGNTVTVSGSVTATATSGVSTIALEITLPIASTFTQNYQCAGTGAGASGLSAANTLMVVNADTSTHLAYCQVFPGGTASTQYWLHFTYQIL